MTLLGLDKIAGDLARKQRALDEETGRARAVISHAKDVQSQVATLEEDATALEEAAVVLQQIAESRQTALQGQIEALVTHGLQTIFGQDLSFHMVQKPHGRLAGTDLIIRSTINGALVETPILAARGGGVAAVAGFLLRLVVLLLSASSTSSPVLILDETFAQLSEEYEPRLSEFIRDLVDKTNAQIIMVTHSDAYTDQADIVHRFRLVDGITQVSTTTQELMLP